MELLLIKHVDIVLWIGQIPGKGVFVILIFVQFHQQSICYCSIVVIHLLFSSPTARTSAKRFWIWACWDRARCFYIFMNCVVHWHSFSSLLPRAHAQWHQLLWVCVQEIHMCRGHTGGCKSTGLQKHSKSEEQNYWLIFEWCRGEEEEPEAFMVSPGIVMKSNGL